MANGIHEFTATGRQKKPSEELICSWISEGWNNIPAEMVTAAFLKCGIMSNLDGSEDELIYNSTDDTDELDDSFVRELFQSDSGEISKVSSFERNEHCIELILNITVVSKLT